jgi:hypothetical protein
VQDNLRMMVEMLRHDPAVVIGLLLIGAFSILFRHVPCKVRDAGSQTYPMFSRPKDWGLPFEYLKIHKKQG